MFDIMTQCHVLVQLCRDGSDIEAIRLAAAQEPTDEVRDYHYHLIILIYYHY